MFVNGDNSATSMQLDYSAGLAHAICLLACMLEMNTMHHTVCRKSRIQAFVYHPYSLIAFYSDHVRGHKLSAHTLIANARRLAYYAALQPSEQNRLAKTPGHAPGKEYHHDAFEHRYTPAAANANMQFVLRTAACHRCLAPTHESDDIQERTPNINCSHRVSERPRFITAMASSEANTTCVATAVRVTACPHHAAGQLCSPPLPEPATLDQR